MTQPSDNVFSFGGGRQSVAAFVLAKRKLIDCYTFMFSNVGEDSEHPDTLHYVRDVMMPYAEKNNMNLFEIKNERTLRQRIFSDNRSVPIPMYLMSGAPGNRQCTNDLKIRRINQWLAKSGYTDVRVGIGFSVDEVHRARTIETKEVRKNLRVTNWYPLLDLRMSLNDCVRVIAEEGLPIPPKSACYFCPFQSDTRWLELKRKHPDLFDDACKVDERLRALRVNVLKKDGVYIHRSLTPLRTRFANDQDYMFGELDVCESGHCFL